MNRVVARNSLLLWFVAVATARGGDAVQPGEVFIERPTLVCLGFRWQIEGDGNRNAAVAVAYRAKSQSEWYTAMPLWQNSRLVNNLFIGSGENTPLPPLDLRLRTGSKAVNAGLASPNVSDPFAGKAPDLGAYEIGAAIPHYGPRR